ncbi:MAG TPA: acylphosphatase [Verrucomicrobiae bacterium]|nr:acylphosphatase [Verrucomicrobiae bacterium]
MRKRATVFYSGRVQGVGFRYTAREIACGYELTGYVRNLNDGRVELVAEGTEEEVRAFLEAVQASQLGSHIRNADVNWREAADEFRGFDVRY